MKLIYKTISFLLGFVFIATANAQIMCSLGFSPGQQYNPSYDQQPSPRASSELNTIYNALCPDGCGNYVLVSNHSAPNALAIAIGSDQSKIAYSPNFMNQVKNQFGDGATFGILAHEFGHHIDFHTTPPWMNNSWSRELKADAWAGCALARVGGSTQQIENSLRTIAAYPSPSHPDWQQRHQAVRIGFINCGGNWLSQFKLSQSQPLAPRKTDAEIKPEKPAENSCLEEKTVLGMDCEPYLEDGKEALSLAVEKYYDGYYGTSMEVADIGIKFYHRAYHRCKCASNVQEAKEGRKDAVEMFKKAGRRHGFSESDLRILVKQVLIEAED